MITIDKNIAKVKFATTVAQAEIHISGVALLGVINLRNINDDYKTHVGGPIKHEDAEHEPQVTLQFYTVESVNLMIETLKKVRNGLENTTGALALAC